MQQFLMFTTLNFLSINIQFTLQQAISNRMYVPIHSLTRSDICSVLSIALPQDGGETRISYLDQHHNRRTMLLFILLLEQKANNERLMKFINDCRPNIQWTDVLKTVHFLIRKTEPYQWRYSSEHLGEYWELEIKPRYLEMMYSHNLMKVNRPQGFLDSELKIYWNYHQIESLAKCKFYNPVTDNDTRYSLLTWPVKNRKNQGTIDYVNMRIAGAVLKVPKGKQVIILDFADERIPGGHYLEVVDTQENEILFFSDAYRALLDFKYRIMGGGYFIPEFGVLYVKNVQFLTIDHAQSRLVDLVAAACYDLTGATGLYRLPSPHNKTDIWHRTLRKFRSIIASAVANSEKGGSDTYLLLGPIGTGALNNSMEMIASLFAEVLNNPLMNSDGPIRNAFDHIWFVSPDNLDVFKETFDNY